MTADRTRGWREAAGAVLALAALLVSAVPAAARLRHCRACEAPYGYDPWTDLPEEDLPPGGYPYGDIPFQWDDHANPPFSENPPLPQGFVLTYTVRHGSQPRPKGPLNRYADVGRALAACWASSDATTKDWREVTLRLSFKRDGSINGVPRVQYINAPGDASTLSNLRSGFLSTLGQCAPLTFSPSLGAAIAGQIFSIRFVQAKDT